MPCTARPTAKVLLAAVSLILLVVAGCTPLNELVGTPTAAPVPPTETTPTTSLEALASRVPTRQPSPTATPTRALQPRVFSTPSPLPAPATSLPPTSETDWASQELALLPEWQADLGLLDNPTCYRMDLIVDMDQGRLRGHEGVHYTNNEDVPLPELYLRLFPNADAADGGRMEIDSLTVDGREVTLSAYELEQTALRVPLEPALAPNESLDLEIEFRVSVPLGPGGNYGAFSSQQGVMALAHAYPFVPVYDDEGWNIELAPQYGDIIYADMSLYDVSLTVPEEMIVVASGAPLPIVAHDDGTATWRFVSGPARDVNIVISHLYQSLQQELDGRMINVYFLPGDREGAARLLDVAVESMRVFNRRFGPYPYTELDVVPTFTSAAGIEYPGLIVIAEPLYENGDRAEWVMAHEVGHQWWYNLVGNDQVDEPWLDEALVQYSTALYYEDRYGSEVGELARQAGLQDRWDRVLNEGQDRPVVGSVASFAPEEYSPIVYGKGALFFHALRELVGDSVFDDILRTYFEEHRYGIATAESLMAVAEGVSGRDLGDLYREWILQ